MKKRRVIGLFLLAAVILGAALGPKVVEKGLKLLYPKPYVETVRRETAEFRLDENLVYAVIKAESGFQEDAQSHADAHGLMQLTPSTFRWMASQYPPENGGGDIFDPSDNIHCGCALLRLLLDQFESPEEALCAYNAGMGNVAAWLENPEYSEDGKTLSKIPYPETAAYLEKVKRYYRRYGELYGEQSRLF